MVNFVNLQRVHRVGTSIRIGVQSRTKNDVLRDTRLSRCGQLILHVTTSQRKERAMARKIRVGEIIQSGHKLLITREPGKRTGETVGQDFWRVVDKVMCCAVNGGEDRRPAWLPAFHGHAAFVALPAPD